MITDLNAELKKGKVFSLDELIQKSNNLPIPGIDIFWGADLYGKYMASYRMTVALQQLQTVVEASIKDPACIPYLFVKRGKNTSYDIANSQARANIDFYELAAKKNQTADADGPADLDYGAIKRFQARAGDPLAMACKHVIDLAAEMDHMGPRADSDSNEIYNKWLSIGTEVHQLAMAMAQNAVNKEKQGPSAAK